MRPTRLVCAAAILFLVAVVGPLQLLGQTIPVQAGVTVLPDTVRVGDPFQVTVGVRAPRGATIQFPDVPDSTATVQALDPRVLRTVADSTGLLQYATYRVAAWDIGTQPIRLGDVVVTLGRAARRISLSGRTVFVQSVLPTDSAKRVPKPPRPLFETSAFPWWLVGLAIAALLAVGLYVWWWRRRRRRPPTTVPVADPYARAEEEFIRIDALGLLEVGERGRYVALVIEVLRDYLGARFQQAPLSLTSAELSRALRSAPTVAHDRLARVLGEADLVKFARRPISSERAREIGREARAIVREERAASRPPAQAAA